MPILLIKEKLIFSGVKKFARALPANNVGHLGSWYVGRSVLQNHSKPELNKLRDQVTYNKMLTNNSYIVMDTFAEKMGEN